MSSSTAALARAEPGAHFQLYRSSPTSSVRWRLLGGNNRALGRSALDFADVESCLLALAELGAGLPVMVGRVDRVPPNLWLWRLSYQESDVAISAHTYDRQIRSQHALAQFRALATVARIDAAVLVSAARRWRSISATPPSGREPIR